MKSVYRSLGTIVLGVFLGCASEQAPHASSATTRTAASDATDRACQQLLTGLEHHDYVQAESVFSPPMKSALPKEKLEATWNHLRAEVGELSAWHAIGRDSPSDHDRRLFELRHERGTLEARIIFEQGGDQVIGLFFARRGQTQAQGTHESTHPDVLARDITIGSGPFSIGATTTSPKSNKGPFPAALLVAGSGPQDRDESIGPNKPFRDLAEGLSARGIVVLRFDKRTLAHADAYLKNGNVNVASEVIDDAVEALRYLRDLPEVDSKRLFIVGHSLGALVAPDIASQGGPVAGLALLGVPGRSIPEVVMEQVRYAGLPAPELTRLEQKLQRLTTHLLPPDEQILGAPASYWWDLMDRDEPGLAKKLGKPVLLVRGERDFQTSAADQAIWQTALGGQAHSVTLPDLNHLFIKGTGKPTPEEYMTPGKVDPALIELISAFVLGAEQ